MEFVKLSNHRFRGASIFWRELKKIISHFVNLVAVHICANERHNMSPFILDKIVHDL